MKTLQHYIIETLSGESPKKGMKVYDYAGEEWSVLDFLDVERSSNQAYKEFLKKYDESGEMEDEFRTLDDLINADYAYICACENEEDDTLVACYVWGEDGVMPGDYRF